MTVIAMHEFPCCVIGDCPPFFLGWPAQFRKRKHVVCSWIIPAWVTEIVKGPFVCPLHYDSAMVDNMRAQKMNEVASRDGVTITEWKNQACGL